MLPLLLNLELPQDSQLSLDKPPPAHPLIIPYQPPVGIWSYKGKSVIPLPNNLSSVPITNENNPTGNDYALNMEPEVVPSAAQIGKCNCKHVSLKSFINLLPLSLCIVQ